MDYGILINVLKNGSSYTIENENAEAVHVAQPPTRHTIAAANALLKIIPQLNESISRVMQLQQELEQALAENERIRKLILQTTNKE
jgi:hypothetical protein